MSIAKDTGYNLAAAAAPAIFMLVAIPFYIPVIGVDRFGVLAICWTIVAAVGFTSLGMGPALNYRLAALPPDAVLTRSSLIWTALLLGLAASLAGMLIVIGVGELYFRHLFQGGSALETEIREALPVLAALLPVAIAIGVLNGALQGTRNFAALSGVNILNAAVLTGAPFAVAMLVGVKLHTLILGTVCGSAAVALIQLAICAWLVDLRAPTRPKMPDIKALLGYGAWMSGTALIGPIVLLIDRFVIGALRGPAAVAVYVLPYNLVQQMVLLPASLTSAVQPRLALLPQEEVQQLQSSSIMWLNGLITPASIVAIVLAGPFFHLWIGAALAKAAAPAAAILLVGGWAHGVAHIPAMVVVGRNRPDLLTKLLLTCVVPYVILLYLGTAYFGVLGAAAAWTIRAAFDPYLFRYTNPGWPDVKALLISAALLLSAMVTALTLSWMTIAYWVVMAFIVCVALFRSRAVALSSAGEFRSLIQGTR